MIYTALDYKDYLISKGFEVKEYNEGVYYSEMEINDCFLRLYFGEYDCDDNPRLQGYLVADRDDLFDKLWKCPLSVRLPFDEADVEKYLKFLASEEGFEYSNQFMFRNVETRKIPLDE